jgi:hypothetical protein
LPDGLPSAGLVPLPQFAGPEQRSCHELLQRNHRDERTRQTPAVPALDAHEEHAVQPGAVPMRGDRNRMNRIDRMPRRGTDHLEDLVALLLTWKGMAVPVEPE